MFMRMLINVFISSWFINNELTNKFVNSSKRLEWTRGTSQERFNKMFISWIYRCLSFLLVFLRLVEKTCFPYEGHSSRTRFWFLPLPEMHFQKFVYIFTACKTFIRVIELDIIPIQNFLLWTVYWVLAVDVKQRILYYNSFIKQVMMPGSSNELPVLWIISPKS